ncbi:MAG: hypothetical protein NTV06_10255, partial [candidate division Zixibacteria bacterium]|nr:hypothetical protein [candidate division Zixibacteria bacterium]
MKTKITCLMIAILLILLGVGAFRFWSMKSEGKVLPMFPKWKSLNASSGYYDHWNADAIVCIVQYIYNGSSCGYKYEDIQQMRKKWKAYTTKEGDYPVVRYVPIKTYADKDIIKKIIDKLNSPKQRQNSDDIETEDYLLMIDISRELNSQTIIRVPYKLAEEGYAITPRGKDKELYEILNSGLKEWDAQLKAEKEEREARVKKSDAIFHLYKQARESEKVDYKSLFLELKKLDALFGAKDPNELEQRLKGEKEGMRQMRGHEEPNQPN